MKRATTTFHVCLLRAVNVGGRTTVPMAALKDCLESAGCRDVKTLLNSGNAVFRAEGGTVGRVEPAIARSFAPAPAVLLRTAAEFAEIARAHPLAGADRQSSRLLVMFLSTPPGAAAMEALCAAAKGPEELALAGRELYLYYPEGVGRSKLTGALIEKALGVRGTARSWTTVLKLNAAAQRLA
jgi:uncharacterized protein (DUF1697 family)